MSPLTPLHPELTDNVNRYSLFNSLLRFDTLSRALFYHGNNAVPVSIGFNDRHEEHTIADMLF